MDIKALLDCGDSEIEHLRRQRESLLAHRRETDAMIEALDILLEDAMNDNELTLEEIGEILGRPTLRRTRARPKTVMVTLTTGVNRESALRRGKPPTGVTTPSDSMTSKAG